MQPRPERGMQSGTERPLKKIRQGSAEVGAGLYGSGQVRQKSISPWQGDNSTILIRLHIHVGEAWLAPKSIGAAIPTRCDRAKAHLGPHGQGLGQVRKQSFHHVGASGRVGDRFLERATLVNASCPAGLRRAGLFGFACFGLIATRNRPSGRPASST